MFIFQKILIYFIFLLPTFCDSPFALLPKLSSTVPNDKHWSKAKYWPGMGWLALHKKRPYSDLLRSVFSHIRTEYSVRMRKNTDQNNCEYGYFLRSVELILSYKKVVLNPEDFCFNLLQCNITKRKMVIYELLTLHPVLYPRPDLESPWIIWNKEFPQNVACNCLCPYFLFLYSEKQDKISIIISLLSGSSHCLCD